MKVQVVIDIPDEAYDILLSEQKLPHDLDLEYLIMHGTLLPKGHGRLIDAEWVIKDLCEYAEKNMIECDYIFETFLKAFRKKIKAESEKE